MGNSVDNLSAGSLTHIFISEGDRSPSSASRSGNLYSELLPPRSASRISPCFSSKRPTHHLKKKVSHLSPRF